MFEIVGIDNSIKVPAFYGEVSFASGTLSAAGVAMAVLLVGMRGPAGNLALDSEVRLIQSETDAITAADRGYQLHRMYRAVMKANPLATVYMAAVTEPGAGSAATVTGVITGTPTADGQITFYCAGETIVVPSAAATDTVDLFGARVAAAFTAKPDLPFTCAYNAATDTLTWTHRHKGALGKDQVLLMDSSQAKGFAIALTGSAALSGSGLTGVKFGVAGGVGAEDVSTLLAANGMIVKRFARIAAAQNDATNAALWETFVNTQAGPTKLMVEHVIFGQNGSQANATSLAQTTLNAPRAQVVAARNYEMHPCEVAAYNAGLRVAVESTGGSISTGTGPVPDYNGRACGGMPPQRIDSDQWSFTEKNALLNAGVTPLETVNGVLRITRAITTYCLDSGSAQDERCLDIGDAVMPDYAIIDLQLLWSEFRAANPGVRDNPVPGEDVAEGLAYPDLWLRTARIRLKAWVANGWIEDRFSDNAKAFAQASGDSSYYKPARASFNRTSKRIQSAFPIVVTRVQSSLLAKVQQTQDLA